ncbi:FAD-binding protein [Streptomyces sp. NPDC006872]|uniref:FAD-binding oxidoreductase n=1 Tax=Streptomyces sp. NPDC006872 TaxID=3155720 RepID=UPI0033C5A23A
MRAPIGVTAPARFRGALLTPADPGYDIARTVHNERAAAAPALIARCAGVADVRAALQLARREGLEIAVRGGGHSVGGYSSVGGGLVIDVSGLDWVRVDPATCTAWVGGGTRAIDLLIEAGEFGLVAVTGTIGTIGVGGLLLGLGEGYLTGRHGFGIDNVLELEVVTADERVLRVSADDNPDLFWAMRGAGANFGVVTAMRLRLHPAPERPMGGRLAFAGDDLAPVTAHLWQAMRHASPSFAPLATYMTGETGEPVVLVIPAHVGSADAAEQEAAALRHCGTPIIDDARFESYLDLIGEVSNGAPQAEPGAAPRTAWEILRFPFDENSELQQQAFLDQVRALRGKGQWLSLVLWRTAAPPAPVPSAAPRHPGITVFIASYWRDPSEDEARVQEVRGIAQALFGTGLVAQAANGVNHLADPDETRLSAVYGAESYKRLTQVKAAHDPGNRFRHNANIPPAMSPGVARGTAGDRGPTS